MTLQEKIDKLPKQIEYKGNIYTMRYGGDFVESLPKPQTDDKEEKLKALANKHLKRLVTYKDVPCYICGYSVEFDCLIAGTFENRGNGILFGDNDYVLYRDIYDRYFYVPKDIVK